MTQCTSIIKPDNNVQSRDIIKRTSQKQILLKLTPKPGFYLGIRRIDSAGSVILTKHPTTRIRRIRIDRGYAHSPIFLGTKAKRLLERAVWNDTSFLASIDVMDYSLLVGVDEEKHELVLGIIDFMRQYTWDKHLETWVKASGILGGPKNASPTVISPKQYKRRFRKAMSAYFLMVPDEWPSSMIPRSDSQSELFEDNWQDRISPQ
ncbi:UNVERIFIED_CONTAM: 1-phosphatidylinositol-3-phosphate 5-kinase FAB1A [Sesamum calycinum]|uniref:1-phosphatidylinositol-3-phosphate 5-kinase FAB1A n=1 Tax=Sesamum calycinum TaxID=2727403 RepID=A0AAW2NU83_9LAMI